MTTKLTAKPFNSLTLTPGRYLIVDPCYVFPDERWSEFCDTMFAIPGNKNCCLDSQGLVFSDNDIEFFVCGTAHGDGYYSLKESGISIGGCGVDAGLLAIIPENLIEKWNSKDKYTGIHENFGGVWIDIKKDTPIEVYRDGCFSFGSFDMNTDWENEEEEMDKE